MYPSRAAPAIGATGGCAISTSWLNADDAMPPRAERSGAPTPCRHAPHRVPVFLLRLPHHGVPRMLPGARPLYMAKSADLRSTCAMHMDGLPVFHSNPRAPPRMAALCTIQARMSRSMAASTGSAVRHVRYGAWPTPARTRPRSPCGRASHRRPSAGPCWPAPGSAPSQAGAQTTFIQRTAWWARTSGRHARSIPAGGVVCISACRAKTAASRSAGTRGRPCSCVPRGVRVWNGTRDACISGPVGAGRICATPPAGAPPPNVGGAQQAGTCPDPLPTNGFIATGGRIGGRIVWHEAAVHTVWPAARRAVALS